MIAGSFTALVTPFIDDEIDYHGLEKLTEFQVNCGITGILAVGTTGESPTLSWDEHKKVIAKVVETTRGKCLSIAGAGSNNTREAFGAVKHAAELGADAVLMVDPYYNGPSSLEIRREYYEPVARAFPGTEIIPYIIPGRTGAQLLPEDLAVLAGSCSNISTVKEATGNLENMKRTRACCGPDFSILSGDDSMTFTMMTDPQIKAGGVISVASNLAPKAVADMVSYLNGGDIEKAESLRKALEPISNLVTVKTIEKTDFGDVVCRARNPIGVKTLMAILGMPSGKCRRPMGRMTKNGITCVIEAVKKVLEINPEILKPASEFFNLDIERRIASPSSWEGLVYENY